MKKATTKKLIAKAGTRRGASESTDVQDVLRWLERHGTQKQLEELARYGIEAPRPFGVAVRDLKTYAKTLGVDHELALALWETGRYEARMLACMVDDPARVTLAQMNAWAAEFDNWAIVDTVCFHLFDRSKHAWKKVHQWAKAKPEFKKRAAFALLWSLSVHDKAASDAAFIRCLPLIEEGADDERNFVKKAVNMALRAIGKRSVALNAAAVEIADRLAKAEAAAPRWVGAHAARDLKGAAVRKRLASKGR